MNRTVLLAIVLLSAGCGGSSDESPSSTVLQSPGGNWTGTASFGRPINLIISESGEVRAFLFLSGANQPPIYGLGTVTVSGGGGIKGEIVARNIFNIAAFLPLSVVQRCKISGNLLERVRVYLGVVCSDDFNVVFEEIVLLFADPNYETGSSLADLAGNYKARSRPDTDILNITADGTIFGTYGIEPGCTINGLASEIDTRFNLLDVTWTLSACSENYAFDEGAQFDGFAMRLPASVLTGGYSFYLTSERPIGLTLIADIYDPM